MFEQNNQRKYSIQQNYQIQQSQTDSLMFPRTDTFLQSETLDLLKLKYNSSAHSNTLINACYRSHKTHLVQFYRKFKDIYASQLKQPLISNFYPNESFVNLYQLGRFLQGKVQKYPSIMMGTVPTKLKKLVDNIFQQQGYIPNLQRFLLFYPNYLQKHINLQLQLFEQNHIDNKIAYFLGLIACAQLGSIYGINRMLNKFCRVGGNIQWVTKRKYPQKIRRLLKLNRKMARSIWEINAQTIQEILEGNFWTQNQLALIIQILSFSHVIATLSIAIGLNCEQTNNNIIDFDKLIEIKNDYDKLYYQSNQGQKLAEVIQNINRNSSSNSDEQVEKQKMQKKKQILNKLQSQTNQNRKLLKKSLRRSDNDQMIQNYMKQIGNQLSKQQLYFKIHQVFKPLLQDYHIVQKRSDKDYRPLDASDFNFKYTAFPLLYNLTNKCAQKTLDLINETEVMTSNNFGKSFVGETKSFRKAIRYYSQNLCGYFHFQYDYKNINFCLTMPLKFYIRLLTLSPLHINGQVLKQIKHQEGQLGLFDFGHVALIVANCKMGITLTYCMHSFQN